MRVFTNFQMKGRILAVTNIDGIFNGNIWKTKKAWLQVEALRNIYYIYHDMDYYLLRYAPEDFSEDMIADESTIETYYGVLDVMKW